MTEQNKNLLLRVVTAFTLLPLVLWLIALGGFWFALLIGVAGGLAALEVNQMAAAAPISGQPLAERPAGSWPRWLTATAIASSLTAFIIPLLYGMTSHAGESAMPLRFLFIELVGLALVDTLFTEKDLSRAPLRVGVAVFAPLYTGCTIAALGTLRGLQGGPWWIVLALVVTWFNDTGGYFAGRFLGKHKLYPRISPSKTWEGAIGGAAASTAGAVLVKFLFLPMLPLYGAIVIGLGGSILGPLGDLSESMLKRGFAAKDSGKMLPGHGGLLDRIDALLFVAPFVLFCARHLLSAQ